MSHDPTPRDLELADRANANGASSLLGLSIRAAALHQMAIYERTRRAEQAQKPAPRFYQPAPGMAIIDVTTGEVYWGPFHCCSVYVANGAEHAHRVLIARMHLEALRENDHRDRAKLRFELTDAGRAALATPDESSSSRRIAS